MIHLSFSRKILVNEQNSAFQLSTAQHFRCDTLALGLYSKCTYLCFVFADDLFGNSFVSLSFALRKILNQSNFGIMSRETCFSMLLLPAMDSTQQRFAHRTDKAHRQKRKKEKHLKSSRKRCHHHYIVESIAQVEIQCAS